MRPRMPGNKGALLSDQLRPELASALPSTRPHRLLETNAHGHHRPSQGPVSARSQEVAAHLERESANQVHQHRAASVHPQLLAQRLGRERARGRLSQTTAVMAHLQGERHVQAAQGARCRRRHANV